MSENLKKELLEALGAARSQLEALGDLGFESIATPEAPELYPPCPIGVVDLGGLDPCRTESLEEIATDLGDCQRCPLATSRTRLVFGVGNPNARLVVVGEAPGREEDLQGEPFVGQAGKLLDRLLNAIGLQREDVYICNVLKCRPPQNRDPQADEVETCEPFLVRQLASIQPQLIMALGRFAVQSLLKSKIPISRLRGEWQEYQGIPLMPTFHPAYLLRNPESKRDVWEDLKEVRRRMLSLERER
ncbi:MAG: uracil-DNA glycosylase [Deltaproteobacteria bacterium]|jgi:DNA polymerase|nr:uracil-DNA glycosylase [Deltaproteobacteria bacterium]